MPKSQFSLARTDTILTLFYDVPRGLGGKRIVIDGIRITWCLEDVGISGEIDSPREIIFETPYGDVHVQEDDPAFGDWLPGLIAGSLNDALDGASE